MQGVQIECCPSLQWLLQSSGRDRDSACNLNIMWWVCDVGSPGAMEALRMQLGGRCQGRCPQGGAASAESWRKNRRQPCKERWRTVYPVRAMTFATLFYSSASVLGQQRGNHSKSLAWDGLFWMCSSLSTYFSRISEEMGFHVCCASACLLRVFIYCALFHNLAGCHSWRQLVVNK